MKRYNYFNTLYYLPQMFDALLKSFRENTFKNKNSWGRLHPILQFQGYFLPGRNAKRSSMFVHCCGSLTTCVAIWCSMMAKCRRLNKPPGGGAAVVFCLVSHCQISSS